MTHLSLFSGIGGIDLAAEWAGFETIAFVERDPFCQKVLAKHWPGVEIHGDIKEVDGSRFRGVDLISGGFPCQPYSVAGKRKGSGDERALWPEMLRVIREAKPVWVLGENVRGLLSIDGGRTFGAIIHDLASLGYRVGWCVYGAAHVGACHRRLRVFIVAFAGHAESSGRLQDAQGFEGEALIKSASCCGVGTPSDPSTPNPKSEQGRRLLITGLSSNTGASLRGVGRTTDSPIMHGNASRHQPGCNIPQFGDGGSWRNWRAWLVKPVIRRDDDGFSSRVERLSALGNAVVPAQIYPILKAIADQIQEEKMIQ